MPGLPVVSTVLPEVQKHDGIVEIQNHKDIIAEIEQVLKEDSFEKRCLRSRRMREETCGEKVEDISRLISL